MTRLRKYRFDKNAKPVTAVALRDITDQHYDDAREDDVFLKGDLIPDMPADQFHSWQKAGLIREATEADTKKTAPAKAA